MWRHCSKQYPCEAWTRGPCGGIALNSIPVKHGLGALNSIPVKHGLE